MLKPVRIIAPAAYPVTLQDVKRNSRVDGTDDDALLTAYIEAATAHFDALAGVLGRALINQTWQQKLPYFPDCGVIGLDLSPIQSITSITYYDTDNMQQTLSNETYTILEDPLGVYVTLQVGQTWPDVACREDAVTITYVAGYGATASSVPAPIRQAIMLLVGQWYENREAAGSPMQELPFSVCALVSPFRRVGM